MTRAAVTLALLAVLPLARARADVPVELRDRRIVAVEVAGDDSALVPADSLGIPVGAPLTRGLVRDAVVRLVARGLASDVQVDAVVAAGGVRLVVTIVPRLTLARVEVEGNAVIDDEEAERTMQVAPGVEVSAAVLTRAREALAAAYAERGYPRESVTTALRDTDVPGHKVLVVTVTEGVAERLRAVRFVGEAPAEDVQRVILGALGVSRGDVLDRRSVDDGVRAAEHALRERGYLGAALGPATIDSGPEGATLQVPSAIGPRMTVVVRGRGALPRETLLASLHLGEDRIAGNAGDRALEHRVQETYVKAGFLDATATVRHEPGARPGEGRLSIEVASGPQVEVARVDFPGATHFTAGFLRDQVASYLEEDLPGSTLFYPVDSEEADVTGAGGSSVPHARAIPAPLVVRPARVYYAPTYEEAIHHIAELYQAAGYLDAHVGPTRLERLDPRHARVFIDVAEGPRTLLWNVRLRGNRVVGDHELADAMRLPRGAPFSYLALEEARVRMTDVYKERGYLFAHVEPATRLSADGTRAEVTFDVVERFPVRVRGLVIRGVWRASRSVIEGLVSLHEGQLFRPSEARASEERLLELGLFTGVTIAPEAADLPAREKRVVVTVNERPPQYLDTSLGLSTGQGVRGGLEYGYRDLFGTGVTLSFGVNLGYQFLLIDPVIQGYYDSLSALDRLERRVTLRLAVPYLPGLPNVRATFELNHLRHNERQFGYDKNSASVSLTWRPWRPLTFTASEQVEENNLGLFGGQDLAQLQAQVADDPRLTKLLRVPNGESTLLSTRVVTAVDFRDSPFTPTTGVFASVTGEWARSVSTTVLPSGEQFFSNFIKLSFNASGYVPILGSDVVLALQFRIGRVFGLEPGSQTYPDRQFFLGGVDTMRGYLQDALIPEELASALSHDASGRANPSAAPRGGDAFLLLRGELRFPLLGPLRGGLFMDVGNLWADARDMDFTQLRPTAGLGVRVATPVGPLAFDYGFVLLRRSLPLSACSPSGGALAACVHDEPFEPLGSFHFSIGLF